MKNAILVFKEKRYLLFAIAIAFTFYIFNAILRNIKPFFSSFTQGTNGFLFDLYLILFYHETISLHAVILLSITSLLFGTLVALLVYKARHVGATTGIFATIGAVLGVLGPTCAACGVGLFAIFGVTSLGFLPFNGIEIAYLGIIFLLIGLYFVERDLLTCGLKKGKTSRRE